MRTINNIVLTDPLSDDDDLLPVSQKQPKEKKPGEKKRRVPRRVKKLAQGAFVPQDAAPFRTKQDADAAEAQTENRRTAENLRQEAERQEAARIEAERKEAERQETARREAERKEAERQEAARKEAERQETAKREAQPVPAGKKGAPTGLPPVPPLPETPPQPVFATVSAKRKPRKKAQRPKGEVTLRDATPDDAAALAEIYEYYVARTAVTFETVAPDAAEFRRRIETITEKYPFLVAQRDGVVVGYAYAAPFKARAAYDCSVEVSIYLRRSAPRQGIGAKLYDELEFRLKEAAFVNAYACIAYPNAEDRYLDRGSVDFHTAMGYTLCGVFENCAVKFDTWYSMIWMGKQL